MCITAPLLLHRASGWGKWLAASLMCQPDVFEICSPKAGGKQRCYTAARSACQLSGLPAQSRQAGKTPCLSRLPLLPLHPLSMPGGSLSSLWHFYPSLCAMYHPCSWTRLPVGAQGQWVIVSVSSPGHKAIAEVLSSAWKPYSVLGTQKKKKKSPETSSAPSVRGKEDGSTAHVAIMSESTGVYYEPVKSSPISAPCA